MIQLNTQWISIPSPTIENWDAQIKWAFKEVSSRSDIGRQTAITYIQVGRVYCRYIEETIGIEPYFITHEWDSFCLMHFRDYLLQKLRYKYFAPRTVTHLYNTVSKVILVIHTWGITKEPPLKIDLPKAVKHGKCVAEFTTAFDAEILSALKQLINLTVRKAQRLLIPYTKTGIGKDPRKSYDGWKNWNNMVWFFENNLDGTLYRSDRSRDIDFDYNHFLKYGARHHGGIEAVAERLGVIHQFQATRILRILMMGLCYETGLNSEVVKKLEVDCYHDAHPITGAPYIQYFKARSTGHKQLPIGLFDGDERFSEESEEYNSINLLWIAKSRAHRVKKIISLIKALSEWPRAIAKQEHKNLLCIAYSSTVPSRYIIGNGDMFSGYGADLIKKELISNLCAKLDPSLLDNERRDEEKYITDKIMDCSFALNRFRTTLANRLLKQGASLLEIQAFLGHTNLSTTINYLNAHDLHIEFFKLIGPQLDLIKCNATEYINNKQKYEIIRNNIPKEPGLIYEAGICCCLNPWDPSDEIKSSNKHQDGKPCAAWNHCLFCHNILITSHSLPKLIAYRMRIASQLDISANISPAKATPLLRTISMIDEILGSNVFTETEISRAKLNANNMAYDDLDMVLVDAPSGWKL